MYRTNLAVIFILLLFHPNFALTSCFPPLPVSRSSRRINCPVGILTPLFYQKGRSLTKSPEGLIHLTLKRTAVQSLLMALPAVCGFSNLFSNSDLMAQPSKKMLTGKLINMGKASANAGQGTGWLRASSELPNQGMRTSSSQPRWACPEELKGQVQGNHPLQTHPQRHSVGGK